MMGTMGNKVLVKETKKEKTIRFTTIELHHVILRTLRGAPSGIAHDMVTLIAPGAIGTMY